MTTISDLIVQHFRETKKSPNFLVTFVPYNEGPFAKHREKFILNPFGKSGDWARKFCDSYFSVFENCPTTGSPHVHMLVRLNPDKIKKKSFQRTTFARGHIKGITPDYKDINHDFKSIPDFSTIAHARLNPKYTDWADKHLIDYLSKGNPPIVEKWISWTCSCPADHRGNIDFQ